MSQDKPVLGKWVPLEPTLEMVAAGETIVFQSSPQWECAAVYRAMLAAAPHASAQTREPTGWDKGESKRVVYVDGPDNTQVRVELDEPINEPPQATSDRVADSSADREASIPSGMGTGPASGSPDTLVGRLEELARFLRSIENQVAGTMREKIDLKCADALDEAAQSLRALEADAKRYRFLKAQLLHNDKLDAHIDSALSQESAGKGK